jgi:hypothetical protein
VHGPEKEIEKLRGSLADLKPQFFTLQYGFRGVDAPEASRPCKAPSNAG